MTLPAPLEPLAAYRQWIIYRLVPHPTKPGKTDKKPAHHATGQVVSLMDPANWTDHATAAAAVAAGRGHGVGFVFTAGDPFWFLDVDDAFTPGIGDGPGEWSPIATELYGQLQGAAWEVSQSGRGLHAIGTGLVVPHSVEKKGIKAGLYDQGRFIALTLNCYEGGSALANLPVINEIAGIYWPPLSGPDGTLPGWTDEPVDEWCGPDDDETLLRMAKASKSAAQAFGGAVSFTDLWEANESVLAARWPSDSWAYGQSEADAALASHLAFWTGKNCERISRLMRQSALARDKWDRTSAYLEPTILRACAVTSKVLQQSPATEQPPVAPDAAKALETGAAFGAYVPPADFHRYFHGCAYVIAPGQIYTPGHGLLGSTAFDTVYGGRMFVLDGEGRKVTSSAWEAFRVNQQWRPPIADDLCFRPELEPGSLTSYEGRTLVNNYVPIETRRVAGDIGPFLDFLSRILPNPNDRNTLTSYMAAVIQNPGLKAQWWPVLQGVEGNGKTLILRCMAHAIGHRYTHLVNPEAMAKTGGQFNAWVQGHLFCGIEEIYVAKRRDFLESFKSTVTNDRIALEGKGVDQRTGDNRCNGIMLTNHPDGVPINTDTRRYAIFYTAQQTEVDLERDGMGDNYFLGLYDWLRADGYAIVNDWLHSLAVKPAFLMGRAPKTSSHVSALRWSLGTAEQEVLEAIEQGQQGFRGGWVSSHYLGLLLERIRAHVPLNKRRDLMRSVGYDYHPAMDEGRCDNVVNPDGNKPRLYLREGHLALNMENRAQITAAYSAAQITVGAAALAS